MCRVLFPKPLVEVLVDILIVEINIFQVILFLFDGKCLFNILFVIGCTFNFPKAASISSKSVGWNCSRDFWHALSCLRFVVYKKSDYRYGLEHWLRSSTATGNTILSRIGQRPHTVTGEDNRHHVVDGNVGDALRQRKIHHTRYFIIKSLNHHNIEKSIEKGIWATQAMNETVLNEAFEVSLFTCSSSFLQSLLVPYFFFLLELSSSICGMIFVTDLRKSRFGI